MCLTHGCLTFKNWTEKKHCRRFQCKRSLSFKATTIYYGIIIDQRQLSKNKAFSEILNLTLFRPGFVYNNLHSFCYFFKISQKRVSSELLYRKQHRCMQNHCATGLLSCKCLKITLNGNFFNVISSATERESGAFKQPCF